MEKKGHTVVVYEMGKEAQKEIIWDQYKKDDKQRHLESCKQDNVPKGDPRRKYKYEEPADLFQILDEDDNDVKYVYGYDFIFAHARPMCALLKTVYSEDAAHLKGGLIGTTHGTWGQDANNHINCMSFSVYFDNESEFTWDLHHTSTLKNIPELDSKENVFIAGKTYI